MENKMPVPALNKNADRDAILAENREIAKSMWSGKLTANEQKMLNNICLIYGLDPLQKQIVVLGGNVYITKSGILNIAHQDENPPEGIEVIPATESERKDSFVPTGSHYWKAIVYKRGMNKPFIEFGEANEKNVNLHNKDWRVISDMAKTRAVNRALRNAYRIGLTSLEEMDLPDVQPSSTIQDKANVETHKNFGSASTTAKAAQTYNETFKQTQADNGIDETITPSQLNRLWAIFKQVGGVEEHLRQYLKATFNIEHTKDIKKSDYDRVMEWIDSSNPVQEAGQ